MINTLGQSRIKYLAQGARKNDLSIRAIFNDRLTAKAILTSSVVLSSQVVFLQFWQFCPRVESFASLFLQKLLLAWRAFCQIHAKMLLVCH